jgi:hypothetical protein
VLSSVEELHYGTYEKHLFHDYRFGGKKAGLVLTNKRLILVSDDGNYRYSMTQLDGLIERLGRARAKWPYQAMVIAPDGNKGLGVQPVETGDAGERGRELSALLTDAVILLGRARNASVS